MSMSHQPSIRGPRAPQSSLLRLPFDGNTPPSVGRVRGGEVPQLHRPLSLIDQVAAARELKFDRTSSHENGSK
jgi:hypothetical protein